MKSTSLLIAAGLILAGGAAPALSQGTLGTTVTYQGYLSDGSGPVNGSVELTFTVWSHPNSTDPNLIIGPSTIVPGVVVADGYFTAEVDFGELVFVGGEAWLEIQVGGDTLAPRQAIRPAPYALALPGLWTQQNPVSPSICGGYAGNHLEDEVEGAVIGGGGALIYNFPGDPNDPNDPNEVYPGKNYVTADYAVICGGTANRAGGEPTGLRATGDGSNSFIGGGSENDANGAYSTIGGGYKNVANGNYTSIIGGRENKCGNGTSHEYGVVCGGKSNQVNEDAAFVGAGYTNNASGICSVICGGDQNTASGLDAFVGGGSINHATAKGAAILGGWNHDVAGEYSAVVGGNDNNIDSGANYALAFGEDVHCTDNYTVMFFEATQYGRLAINRDSDTDNSGNPIIVGTNTSNGKGAYLTPGGKWTDTGSSRGDSRAVRGPDRDELFAHIDALPIGAWECVTTGERQFGVLAEDFHQLFEVGALAKDGTRDTGGLAASDVAGVALAGVQELIRENDELRARVERLEALVETLLERQP